ncbi:5,6-dimethylbenzimidazole synthase [Modestobacter sp. VKM Ac-2986]|uniref:5,6-dimethylbenzimidazole synthase n=1 Tax=Modestobacter sp. VKM Ac-2986 TaxID=3004140 RepID=UPI0022AAB32F|nr:5,6-dimethylbenzimidazole synthase [Modestobacter sp. VKM Ac-2986]MCZ2827439.1 5,6-dimethylbenzimidazole synthase [Modestobacter sp. VKM Ac-2986]
MTVHPRPVPLIGDPTAASERAADPAGWAFDPAERDALHRVVAARRDVRRYRPDPVPADVLERVLTAAHAAPSVGHSQPWRFVVITDPGVRDRAAVLTDRERLRQAAQLEPDAARRLLDLKLEGVRDAPLGVVVCCDRRTAAAGVLGRATYPDADLWSCAAAIQNLWLAARAEGLGMGWVTLFRPADLAELLGLPEGVETLGWLCLGWPDERPPAPGLERAGWSQRLPLADVVMTDRWAGAAPPPSALRGPDQPDVVAARDGGDRLLTPPGSLGVLDAAVDRAVALGRGGVTGGVLVLATADHPVTAHGVSAFDPRVTRDVTEAAVAGTAVGVTAARGAGLTAVVVDAGVAGGPVPGAVGARPAGPRGDLVDAPAMTAEDTAALVAAGRALGREAGATGLVALGEVGVANTTVAAALACALLHVEPAAVVGLGSGADSAMLARKAAVVTAAVARAGRVPDPLTGLAQLGGPELAVLAGVALGAAEVRAVVVVDGFAASLAALAAVQLEPAVQASLVAGQRSRERGHDLVLQALGCEPLLDLRLRAGEGVGAVLAASLLLQGLAVRRTAARVDR